MPAKAKTEAVQVGECDKCGRASVVACPSCLQLINVCGSGGREVLETLEFLVWHANEAGRQKAAMGPREGNA